MSFPTVTAQVASVLAIFQVVLMMRVGLTRAQSQVGIGDGGDPALARKIRVHGNLIENAPIFLIVLGLLEMTGISRSLVSILGLAFFLVRIAHAYALSGNSGASPLRAVGAFGTIILFGRNGGAAALAVVDSVGDLINWRPPPGRFVVVGG
ncbi:MAPEG family protein [filamentous cyanobacterium LEGE 11480]|uniref:MAPEG family protein n=1 Tax=Romeriopsis navalis LEGE 11480 TaxID=2777977 RepID=A0A928VND7_9CYAN|nr:MAPEG family protein [Romeriopsis navalis]MBE9031731.1 MAPEG family protein [Romeriopsis navalis LEGE 11480]